MKKEMIIKYRNKKIKIIVKECNLFGKFKGLMFSSREKAKNLLFNFNIKQKIRIHSFYVLFPFIAIWLDDKNNVVDLKRVRPFELIVSPKAPAYKLIEIPINKKNKNLVKLFSARR